jgi:cyclophilin family peptidyl-prolyl cis-trans isomerase
VADATPLNQLKNPYLVFQTNLGDLTFELFQKEAPLTVNQLKLLAESGAFMGIGIFRVIPGSVVQAHDVFHRIPALTSSELQKFRYLPVENKSAKHLRGALALARNPDDPNTGHSSISIQLQANAALDGKYTLFGSVYEGWDVLEQIQRVPRTGEMPQHSITVQKAIYFSSGAELKQYTRNPTKEVLVMIQAPAPQNSAVEPSVIQFISSPSFLILISLFLLTLSLVFLRSGRPAWVRMVLSILVLLFSMFILGSIPRTVPLGVLDSVKSVFAFGFILYSIWELGKFEQPKFKQ